MCSVEAVGGRGGPHGTRHGGGFFLFVGMASVRGGCRRRARWTNPVSIDPVSDQGHGGGGDPGGARRRPQVSRHKHGAVGAALQPGMVQCFPRRVPGLEEFCVIYIVTVQLVVGGHKRRRKTVDGMGYRVGTSCKVRTRRRKGMARS